MSSPRRRWNDKFTRILEGEREAEVPDWVRKSAPGGPEPLVDLACGLAGTLLWWTEQGRSGIGIDVSDVVLRHLRQLHPGLPLVQGDLERAEPIRFTRATYLLRFFYAPDLMDRIAREAPSGSRVLIETYVTGEEDGEAPINPTYCLEPGELGERFRTWDHKYYREDTEEHPEVARLVAAV